MQYAYFTEREEVKNEAAGRDSLSPTPLSKFGSGREEGGEHRARQVPRAGAPGAGGQCKGAKGATQEPRKAVMAASQNRGSSGPQKPPQSYLGSEGFLS